MSYILLCFDVDGVFHTNEIDEPHISGNINPKLVEQLDDKLFAKSIVSPSPYYPKDSQNHSLFILHNKHENNEERYKNLLESYQYFTQIRREKPIISLYISDNEDIDQAKKANFHYIDNITFGKVLDSDLNASSINYDVCSCEHLELLHYGNDHSCMICMNSCKLD
ncbi:hypothetical protein SCCGRSA3_02038 [Marine Group I thaumarchaeote SCGC RSA3]|uniref:Uncharacterized protein n=2 Tax=Marine Group I TaxID=905826 RepID=A0A081RMX6_9ARCH|nr:hypothetical protein AAA799N04_01041 [Marine Group I thaumarchaeote SCGC AAA799-N04]KFM16835.1 hypothetical protein SCCGRSA3_02038 [Marine Group I thaumarchaeote SCGC RSA3]